MANRYLKLLLENYPEIDLLPFDAGDEAAAEAAVADRTTKDTLFEILWKELADHDGDSPDDVLKTLDQAMRDIFVIRRAVQSAPEEVPAGPRA